MIDKINATKVKAKELKPGDLFSTQGPNYWQRNPDYFTGIGEKVYIRTNSPTPPDQAEDDIYRIEIVLKPEEPIREAQSKHEIDHPQ